MEYPASCGDAALEIGSRSSLKRILGVAEGEGGPDGAGPLQAIESTIALLNRAKAGDASALNRLCERYLPRLRSWARGRLPRYRQDLLDTDDIVQETLLRTIQHVEDFEPRGEGALQAYLRQALLNRIRDEARRAKRRPASAEIFDRHVDSAASPLEAAIGAEALERYEAALKRLRDEDREAIVARIEMDCGYEELARALGKPSADAARMAVSRALVRLAKEIGDA